MSAKQLFESNRKPLTDHMREMALELKQLLSPEKALFLLYNLVDKNPILWQDLHSILHPTDNTTDNATDHVEEQTENNDNYYTQNVLFNLRELQLNQLPLDTLGVITGFLSLNCCLKLTQTNKFFHKTIPKYIDVITLEQDISQQIYKLFDKCERLKHLSIDGTYKDHSIPFLFPFSSFKALKELILVNIRFKANKDFYDEMYKFKGGKYCLEHLQLISCEDIDIENWIKLTSSKHSPYLKHLTIRTYRRVSNILQEPMKDTVYEFTRQLVSSKHHFQITDLALTIHNLGIIKAIRRNKHFIHNLRKFEIGLMDRRCEEENANNISVMFQALFSQKKNKHQNLYNFKNLEILLIDFCPNIYSRGYNDISPLDLSNFSNNIPKVFPELKLLGLYGSMTQLLFNDSHLNGLLSADCVLTQIIDLSLGFEDLSANCDNLIRDLLMTFPNLAWLTLENEQFLMESETFHKIVNDSFDENKLNNLQWITLCASEKDEIYELPNGVFIEYWERGIEQCDFDAALDRSQEIIKQRLDQITDNMGSITL